MDKIFTRFIDYYSIDTSDVDLFEDAFGLGLFYHDIESLVFAALDEPSEKCVVDLLLKAGIK